MAGPEYRRPLEKLLSLLRKVRKVLSHSPLTLFGALLLFASLALLGTGIFSSDSFAATAGFLGLLLCIGFGVFLSFYPGDGILSDLHWNSGPDLSAGKCNASHSIALAQWKLPPFLRLHARIMAHVHWENTQIYSFTGEYRLEGREELPINLTPPLSGILSMHGEFYLKDVFGIAKKRLGEVRDRSTWVVPSPQKLQPSDPHSNTSSDENRKSRSSEEEKIFIRDYQTGDLARDINWKAAGRINKLLTRIPPESESETKLLRLYVLGRRDTNCAPATWFYKIDYVKAIVAGYLDAMFKHEKRNILADLHLGKQIIPLREKEDLHPALRALAAWLPGCTDLSDQLPADPPSGNCVVFSHADAEGLGSTLIRLGRAALQLYLVRPWNPADAEEVHRTKRYFPADGFTPLIPPGSIPARRRKPGGISPDAMKKFEYILKTEF